MKIDKNFINNHDVRDHNKEIKKEVHSYWRRAFDSTSRAMSRGAQHILKLITTAHGDNWRRSQNKK